MQRAFHTVLPDLRAADPLHPLQRTKVRETMEDYAAHIGAHPDNLPFVPGRYTGGLYGGKDPGAAMHALPEISANPESAIIMIATDRKMTAKEQGMS
jgi:hypothetical protein